MGSNIGQRLKNYRTTTGAKMPEIARNTGIKKENLYKWEKGTKPSDFDEIRKLEEYISAEENRNRSKNGASSLNSTQNAGYFSPENLTLKEIFGSPLQTLVTITEEAMLPDYKPGWKLCLRKLPNQLLLVWGRAYFFKLIDNERGLLRRVVAGENPSEIMLLSKNEIEYPPITVNINEVEIHEILGVMAVL